MINDLLSTLQISSPFQFNKKTRGNKKKKPVSGIIDKNYTKRANLANLSGMSHPWWPIFLVWKQYLISLENIFLFVPFEPEIFSSMAFCIFFFPFNIMPTLIFLPPIKIGKSLSRDVQRWSILSLCQMHILKTREFEGNVGPSPSH